MITFTCESCKKGLRVRDELAGKKARCPHCKQPVSIPAMSTASAGNVSVQDMATIAPGTVLPDVRDGATIPPGGPNDTGGVPKTTNGVSPELYDFLAPPQAPDEIGRLGGYRVLKVLGAGGMGVVYQAEDPQLARAIALKVMLPALAASASNRQRFLQEARLAAQVEHDHVVAVLRVDEDRNIPYMAMPLLRGESLEDRLKKQKRLPAAEAVRIGRETALGLGAAHDRDLIHRDIKPANVWLEKDTGRVKILDFGLARSVGQESHLTQQGAILGTPAYMAPEQASGKAIDGRADLFSVGCMLYRLLTGELPFKGTDPVATLMAVATHNPKPPRELNREVSPALSKLVMSLLAKDPAGRPANARELVAALDDSLKNPGKDEKVDTLEVVEAPVRRPRRDEDDDEKVQTTSSRRRFHEDDEDDEDDDRRSRPAKPRESPTGDRKGLLLVVAACSVFGLILVVGGLVWAFAGRGGKGGNGTIVVDVDQPGAEIFLDGRMVGLTPRPGEPFNVPAQAGGRELRVTKGGFVTFTQTLNVASGKSERVSVRLTPNVAGGPKPPIDGGPKPRDTAGSKPKPPDPKDDLLKPVQIFSGNTPHSSFMALAPNGKSFVTCSDGRAVLLVWDTDRQVPSKTIIAKGNIRPPLVVSPDGNKLGAFSSDNVFFWDRLTGNEILSTTPASGFRFCGVGITDEGKLLAAITGRAQDKTVILITDVEAKKPIALLTNFTGNVKQVLLTPDGKKAVTSTDDAVLVWDVATSTQLHRLAGPPRTPEVMAMSFDGRRLLTSHSEKRVYLWDLASGREERTFEGDRGKIDAVAFSPDGKWVSAGGWDSIAWIWDAETGTVKYKCKVDSIVTGIVLAPELNTAIICNMPGKFHAFRLEPPPPPEK